MNVPVTDERARTAELSRTGNNALVGIFGLFGAAVLTSQAYGSLQAHLVFNPIGLAMFVLAVRVLLLCVRVGPDGIMIRNVLRTHRLAWAEVAAVVDQQGTVWPHRPGVRTADGRTICFTAYSIGKPYPRGLADQWIAVVEAGRQAAS